VKILYVEDEKYMARAVAQVLKRHNYDVDLAHDGEAGLELALSAVYDLIVLDIMLPKLDGIAVLRHLRQAGCAIPCILLTAKGETADKVRGLDSGADDYLTKPFETAELLARIRALARRRGQTAPDNMLSFGDVALNYNTLDLFGVDGKKLRLTPKESGILELLMLNRGQAVTVERIIEKLWGWDSDTDDSHVQVQMAFLRKKLALLSGRVKITTIRSVGYMLAEEAGVDGDV
jgi:DNA-binding response OmpR family regulator